MFAGDGKKVKLTPYLAMAWKGLADLVQWLDPVETPDHVAIWPLGPSEATQCGAATEALMNGSMTAAQKKKLEKWLNKNMPWIVFGITIGSVFGPRAKYSLDVKKVQRAKLPSGKTANAQRTAQSGTTQAPAGVSPANPLVVEPGATNGAGTVDESVIFSS